MVLKGYGPPHEKTAAQVGDRYFDQESCETYECVSVKTAPTDYGFVDIHRHTPESEYVWVSLLDGVKTVHLSGTDCVQLFQSHKRLDLLNFNLETSSCTDFSSMFDNCYRLTSVPELDTSNGTAFGSMFCYCSKVTAITGLDLNKSQGFIATFSNCSALTTLIVYNIRKALTIGSGTTSGHLLTVDSLVHTIKELCTVTTQQTLTMGIANLAKIADLYCKVTDDTTEKIEMELCESTDEGAITLSDYALMKNWLIQ